MAVPSPRDQDVDEFIRQPDVHCARRCWPHWKWRKTKTFRLVAEPLKSFSRSIKPNPFNPSTTINYRVPTTTSVDISIFNVLGQLVRTLVNRVMDQGTWSVTWDEKTITEEYPLGHYHLCNEVLRSTKDDSGNLIETSERRSKKFRSRGRSFLVDVTKN